MRWYRNCDSDTNESIAWAWDPSLRRCPKAVITQEAWALLSLCLDWKRTGITVRPGGMGEQPAYFHEAVLIFEAEREKAEAHSMRQQLTVPHG